MEMIEAAQALRTHDVGHLHDRHEWILRKTIADRPVPEAEILVDHRGVWMIRHGVVAAEDEHPGFRGQAMELGDDVLEPRQNPAGDSERILQRFFARSWR